MLVSLLYMTDRILMAVVPITFILDIINTLGGAKSTSTVSANTAPTIEAPKKISKLQRQRSSRSELIKTPKLQKL